MLSKFMFLFFFLFIIMFSILTEAFSIQSPAPTTALSETLEVQKTSTSNDEFCGFKCKSGEHCENGRCKSDSDLPTIQ